MPTSKSKSDRRTKPKRRTPAAKPAAGEILTLAEAAAYLRVSEEAVLHEIGPQGLPGRLIEGEWRFLKSAVEEWLGTPSKPSGKAALLNLAGAFKDDPFLEEIVNEAYRQRGRPITENAE